MIDGFFALAFYVLAAVSVGSALMVVFSRNLFHAALFLIVAFIGVAGIFVTLHADFLAAAQVLLYVGAIAVLLIFGILLTRDVMRGSPQNQQWISAGIVAVLMFLLLVVIVQTTVWPVSPMSPLETTVEGLADALFYKFILPFEVASVLLMAAVIGAIVLARED